MNLAKVATGLVAGVSHWRFGNIDRRLVLQLAIPGAIGALIGTTVLVHVDGDDLRPFLAVRAPRSSGCASSSASAGRCPLAPDADGGDAEAELPPFDERGVEVAAAAGGVTNGLVGAWGPVVTPFLLHRGLPPRFAIGSVNTAEVAVAVVAAGSLITSLGGDGLEVGRGARDARRRHARGAARRLRRAVRARPRRWAWPSPACCSLTQTRELATAASTSGRAAGSPTA